MFKVIRSNTEIAITNFASSMTQCLSNHAESSSYNQHQNNANNSLPSALAMSEYSSGCANGSESPRNESCPANDWHTSTTNKY